VGASSILVPGTVKKITFSGGLFLFQYTSHDEAKLVMMLILRQYSISALETESWFY
jgi:hypothetical protein